MEANGTATDQLVVPVAVIITGSQLAALKMVPFQQVALVPLPTLSSYSSRWTPEAPAPVSEAVPQAAGWEQPAPQVVVVMTAFWAGLVTEAVGAVVSVTTVIVAAVLVFPAESTARTDTRWEPSARTPAVPPPTEKEPLAAAVADHLRVPSTLTSTVEPASA